MDDLINKIIGFDSFSEGKGFIEQCKDLISTRIKTISLLEQQQELLDEAYKLSDILEDSINKEEDIDILEIVSKEHIDNRVKLKDEDKAIFNDICSKYGYSLIWRTILEDIEVGKQKDTKN